MWWTAFLSYLDSRLDAIINLIISATITAQVHQPLTLQIKAIAITQYSATKLAPLRFQTGNMCVWALLEGSE